MADATPGFYMKLVFLKQKALISLKAPPQETFSGFYPNKRNLILKICRA